MIEPNDFLGTSEEQEMMDEPEYKKYIIILTLLYGNSLNQLKLEVYFNNEEANSAFTILNKKIFELTQMNSPVSLSLVSRNADGDVIRRGVSGIVGIEHNIPQFTEVLEDEI